MTRIVSLLLVASVTTAANASVYTGNPVGIELRLEQPGAQVDVVSAELVEITLDDCAGNTEIVTVDEVLDASEDVAVDLPTGAWCEATLHWGEVTLSGQNGGSFEVEVLDADTTVPLDAVTSEAVDAYQVVTGQVSSAPVLVATPVE